MRDGGGRAHSRWWRLAASRRQLVWLGATVLAAAATIVALLAFNGYATTHRAAATQAAAAGLQTSQLDSLKWQTTATGVVSPWMYRRAARLVAGITEHLRRIGNDGAPARSALAVYAPAVRAEFVLIASGRIAAEKALERQRVGPAFRRLSAALHRVVTDNARAAGEARTVATAGEIGVVIAGFVVVTALLLRFSATRRALAAAEVEERLLRETDQAKSNMINVVSHNLRTPLTSVVGYLELFSDPASGPLTDEQQRFLEVMRRNTDRLQAILSDLLLVSRVEAGAAEFSLAELNLAEAAADAVTAHRPQALAEGVDLRLAAIPSPRIMGDRHRVDEMIENLVSNALKFTPAGGEVVVAVGPTDHSVRLEVSDTGIGISQHDQEHLFERFFRGAEVSGLPGTGLGLAIVKALAEGQGATVSVRSRLGEGTAFRVDFPQAAGLPLPRQHAG